MFKMKKSSYNETLANEAINGQNIYIVGRELTTQRKYVDNSQLMKSQAIKFGVLLIQTIHLK